MATRKKRHVMSTRKKRHISDHMTDDRDENNNDVQGDFNDGSKKLRSNHPHLIIYDDMTPAWSSSFDMNTPTSTRHKLSAIKFDDDPENNDSGVDATSASHTEPADEKHHDDNVETSRFKTLYVNTDTDEDKNEIDCHGENDIYHHSDHSTSLLLLRNITTHTSCPVEKSLYTDDVIYVSMSWRQAMLRSCPCILGRGTQGTVYLMKPGYVLKIITASVDTKCTNKITTRSLFYMAHIHEMLATRFFLNPSYEMICNNLMRPSPLSKECQTKLKTYERSFMCTDVHNRELHLGLVQEQLEGVSLGRWLNQKKNELPEQECRLLTYGELAEILTILLQIGCTIWELYKSGKEEGTLCCPNHTGSSLYHNDPNLSNIFVLPNVSKHRMTYSVSTSDTLSTFDLDTPRNIAKLIDYDRVTYGTPLDNRYQETKDALPPWLDLRQLMSGVEFASRRFHRFVNDMKLDATLYGVVINLESRSGIYCCPSLSGTTMTDESCLSILLDWNRWYRISRACPEDDFVDIVNFIV